MSMLLTFMLSMLLAITRKHHKEVNGPGYWAVGNLVIGLGTVLVLIQLDAEKLLFLPGMALIGAGLGLYINGIQAFNSTSKNTGPRSSHPHCHFCVANSGGYLFCAGESKH